MEKQNENMRERNELEAKASDDPECESIGPSIWGEGFYDSRDGRYMAFGIDEEATVSDPGITLESAQYLMNLNRAGESTNNSCFASAFVSPAFGFVAGVLGELYHGVYVATHQSGEISGDTSFYTVMIPTAIGLAASVASGVYAGISSMCRSTSRKMILGDKKLYRGSEANELLEDRFGGNE